MNNNTSSSSSPNPAGMYSPERLKLLELRLKQKGISTSNIEKIARRSETDPTLASFSQQRLWFLDQLAPESATYVLSYASPLRGVLKHQALQQSLTELIRRHESLRTVFQLQNEQLMQVIGPPPTTQQQLPLIDLGGLAQEAGEQAAWKLVRQEGEQPFDLAHGPLLRVALVQMDVEEYVVLISMHHIITDGGSTEIFERELIALYQAYVAGKPSPLPPLPLQYADYALWQRNWLQGERLEKQLAYWRQQLENIEPLALPIDHPRRPSQHFQGALLSRQLPHALSVQLDHLAQREQATLFMLLLGAFQVLLARYSGQSDISIGTPIANRKYPELEGLIGFFVNMLVLRTDLSGNPSFLQVLQRTRETALGAYAHQDVPFEYLLEALQAKRDLSRSPLFQVTFRLQQQTTVLEQGHQGQQAQDLAQPGIAGIGEQTVNAKFDLSLLVIQTAHGLLCRFHYNANLFAASTIERIMAHWQTLLEGIVAAPASQIATLPLLTAPERVQLLTQWSTTHAFPYNRSLPQLLQEQAERTPDAIAMLTSTECLSYAALQQRAHALACVLQARGVRDGKLVAVLTPRSLRGVIALLAVWKAGGALLPLEVSWPTQRVQLLLERTQPVLLLTEPELWEQVATTSVPVLMLQEQAPQATQTLQENSSAEQLAYVLYTSGSTGEPKGVMVAHRAIVNRLIWGVRDTALQPGDRVAQLASWSFDIALWELWGPLLVGATVVLVDGATVRDTQALQTRLHKEQISVLHLVPSLAQALLQEPDFGRQHFLRCLLCGGEAVSKELIRQVFAQIGVPLHQYYGPTEGAINATSWTGEPQSVERDHIGSIGSIGSIGRPIANMQLYLVDRWGEVVPEGVPGEIWLGGQGLAWGYLGRGDLTAERFVPDPFSGEQGARLYRTGDIGRIVPGAGVVQFVGRIDGQVKIRGYRVEPGEVENALRRYAGVRECVVITHNDPAQGICLIAYIAGSSAQKAGLQQHLHANLPEYMIPSSIQWLDELPHLTSGKIDRRSLPKPVFEQEGEEEEEDQEPRTALERELVQQWATILGREQLGIHENFFESGGHSLLATRLISRLRTHLHIELSVQALFEAPTIAEFAEIVILEQEKLLAQAEDEELATLLAALEALPDEQAQRMLHTDL